MDTWIGHRWRLRRVGMWSREKQRNLDRVSKVFRFRAETARCPRKTPDACRAAAWMTQAPDPCGAAAWMSQVPSLSSVPITDPGAPTSSSRGTHLFKLGEAVAVWSRSAQRTHTHTQHLRLYHDQRYYYYYYYYYYFI